MAARGELPIDVDAYPDIQMAADYLKERGVQRHYTNRFRVVGTKLSLDGSPQGKTAWLTKPYLKPPAGAPADYTGYAAIPEEQEAIDYVVTAYANNWPLLTHCNGDAAADLYIRAVRKAVNAHGNDDRRTVMIHAQTVREDQLDSMQVLGIIPSFFSMHTFYWGDWHRDETLGPERAYRISPTNSALQRGMRFTEHHDAPVAKPDAIRILWCTVNRVSRSGEVIGPDQRVSPYIALKSMTEWAAYQGFTEDLKGTLETGKLADLVILDRNPLKVEPMAIRDIKVMETIKEGKSIYTRP
jgi:predicted amidohydrolase YtcJ